MPTYRAKAYLWCILRSEGRVTTPSKPRQLSVEQRIKSEQDLSQLKDTGSLFDRLAVDED